MERKAVIVEIVQRMWPRPSNILELGTGQGATGAAIMAVLPESATFTTINYDYPANQVFGEFLAPWLSDHRLVQLVADTLDLNTLDLVPDGVDIMYIDSTHEAWHAAEELRLWQSKLANGAIVVVDDIDHNDMMKFWESLPYKKYIVDRQGVFYYDSSQPYTVSFKRGSTSKEKANK